MDNATTSNITGEILTIETGWSSPNYWFDITMRSNDSHIVTINYNFRRQSTRDSLYNSLQHGMNVTVSVDGPMNFERKIEYKGIGAIRVHDHAVELDKYIGDSFKKEAKDLFTDNEVVLIRDLLETAKHQIKDKFDPSPDETEKIDNHIESLSRKTASVTKYDWKRLFVSCVVSISVDLGFGKTIPEVLYNLFKDLVMELIEKRLPYKMTD